MVIHIIETNEKYLRSLLNVKIIIVLSFNGQIVFYTLYHDRL